MLDTMRRHGDRIRYIHLKDVDAAGAWAMLGQGVCAIDAVTALAAEQPHFNGWLVVEEESDQAAADPQGAVRRNRDLMRRYGL